MRLGGVMCSGDLRTAIGVRMCSLGSYSTVAIGVYRLIQTGLLCELQTRQYVCGVRNEVT